MLHHTQGIVLSFIKYRESSIIVKIYTEKFGLQSYIVNSVRSAKSKGKIALYQPLTLIDLVVYKKPSANLNRISEIRCSYPFKTIPFLPYKTSIAIFLSEVLCKSIHEDSEDHLLFDFLFQSIKELDLLEKDFENFHLQFLMQFSGFLGFKPTSFAEVVNEIKSYKTFTELKTEEILLFNALLKSNYADKIKIPYALRKTILEILMTFYQIHINHWGELKSLEVLKEVMR